MDHSTFLQCRRASCEVRTPPPLNLCHLFCLPGSPSAKTGTPLKLCRLFCRPRYTSANNGTPAIRASYISNSCCPGPLLPKPEGQLSCHPRYHPLPRVETAPLPRISQTHHFLCFLALLAIYAFQQGCVKCGAYGLLLYLSLIYLYCTILKLSD